jgi:hypothetical protein
MILGSVTIGQVIFLTQSKTRIPQEIRHARLVLR